MKKDTFYFSHDYNARNDEKIKRLISKHGLLGYGIYWCLIEDLYQNTNVLRLDYECISFDLRCEINVVKSIINDFDLFLINDENFSSLSVQRRIDERRDKSIKARESILSRWEKKKNDTNVLQSNYDSNTIKEKKGKESKLNNNTLLSEIKISDIPEKNHNYYKIAMSFYELFKLNLLEVGLPLTNLEKTKASAIDEIRFIIEKDKYTTDHLRDVFVFLKEDAFWKKNIQSFSKLRKQMEKLLLQIKHKDNGTSKAKHNGATTDEIQEIFNRKFGENKQ